MVHEECLVNSHCGSGDNDDNDEDAVAADHNKRGGERR